MDKLEDIESFLKNVDKISELVNDLKCSDVEVQQKAIKKADCYIAALDEPCMTKVNKTTINTSPPLQSSLSLQNESPENFMKIMERDAEDRRLRRVAQAQKATALKDKGNEAYTQGNYETAVKYYSDGLTELRDMQPLYTNRAQTSQGNLRGCQLGTLISILWSHAIKLIATINMSPSKDTVCSVAYIKLGKYKEAISDCEWALKCQERCIKAYLHMGKAYLALKKYNESRNCFEKIVEIEPGREKMVKEYLTQVDLEEERESQEMNAMQEFDKGHGKATIVPQLLEKLSRPGQMPLYYCGGLEILSLAVTDSTGQTLFRLNNGFSIISSNDTMRSCLLQKTKDPDSQELCVSVLKLWRVICCGNEENQKMLMTCPVTRQSIVDLVTSEHVATQKECLALLCLYSQMPQGRHLAADNLNVPILMRNLMACISKPKQRQENAAVNILENLTAENKFCIQLRSVLTDYFIAPFTTILRNISKSNQHILPSLISAVGSLARDDVICHNFAHDPECWKAFLVAIRQCSACGNKEVLYPMLGLIINLSTITSPVIQEHAVSLCDCCLGLLRDSDGGVITRATGVLSTVLPQSSEAVQHVIQGNVVRTMHRLLKGTGQTATKYAIKTLTVCTAASHLAREELVKTDKKLSILRHLLGSSCDEMVSGNAALCLAYCLYLEGTASNLLGTDIVLLLLRHAAGDAKRTAVQQNAAIALGKLCQSEPRLCPRQSRQMERKIKDI
ncbi:tetratricopeptide repeat protein 12 isoform X3 [Micropterus dolomieu]|uniref:tetratricopeptide repeat protein 12 isoform X3 n=1 Tax=Micropterus dolomieu TaxID=147949 RepID=UPI001E8C9FA3|nr:tetratricopeptide repeat protein 12 isoform X3 [Micropterus dolomieu]